MIIYGTRATHIQSKNLMGEKCHNCKEQDSLSISLFGRYFHVFWMPLFPIGKTGITKCSHCKALLEVKEMPDNLKRQFQKLKSEAKAPRWHFAGLGLIALIAVGLGISIKEEEKRELENLAAPLVNDVYEYKTDTGNYSTLKVTQVTKDSVFVLENRYEIDKITQVDSIDKAVNYLASPVEISRNKIKELYDNGEIYSINRD